MIHQHASYLILVSDLHLGAGSDAITGHQHRFEDFCADDTFAQCVSHFQTQAAQVGGLWRLVFLGDLVDFLHARTGTDADDLPLSVAAAQTTLARIAAGHPVFFGALQAWIAAGFAVDVVPGNHDIEFLYPALQAQFRALLVGENAPPEQIARIRFFPWIYHIPGVLYAEHGQQYHDINAFPDLGQAAAGAVPTPLKLPLGTYFDDYLCALLTHLLPNATHSPPSLGAVVLASRKHPLRMLTGFPHHLRFALHATRVVVQSLTGYRRLKNAPGYRAAVRQYAATVDLPAEVVAALDATATLSSAALLVRLARMGFRAVGRRRRHGEHYMLRAAYRIAAIMEGAGYGVPFYVFGHTHAATWRPLAESGNHAHYLNTGTWVSHPREKTTGNHEDSPFFTHFTFAKVSAEAHQACLMHWNATTAAPEILFSSAPPT